VIKSKHSLIQKSATANWHIRFRWDGRDFKPSTGTSVKAEAERVAEDVKFRAIVAHETKKGLPAATKTTASELQLDAVEKLFKDFAMLPKAPRSCPKYIECLRKLRLLHKIETLPQLALFLEKHSLEAENRVRAKIRKNSGSNRPKPLQDGGYKALLRGASGVFSKKALKYYREKADWIMTSPFEVVDCRADFEPFRPPPGGLAFVAELQAAAAIELQDKPQIYLLFLLCLGCGLRAQEATHLRWQDVEDTQIYVRSDTVHKTKSGYGRYVPTSTKLTALIDSHKASNALPGDFVLTKVRNRKSKGLTSIRCCHFQIELGQWLKSKGICKPLTTHPVHYLRKLFGALIVTKHANGYALAKAYLGHDSIQTTEKIYAGLLERPPPEIF
jgi:integrase